MKRKIVVIFAVLAMVFMAIPMSAAASSSAVFEVTASEAAAEEDTSDLIEQVKQQLGAVFENIDQETASEAFAFLKEKAAEGSLATEEGLSRAVEEGKEKFGFEISKEDARELVAAMEKLEDMGFSAEYILDKTESLYQEYGVKFVDHVDEVVTGAVKNAVSSAVSSFFKNLVSSVKEFFMNLFS